MINKCCWIRGGGSEKKCPFGLPITLACSCAGKSVLSMCPLTAVVEEKQEAVELANKRVYIWNRNNKRCIYAQSIIESKNSVNCDFGDVGQGLSAPSFVGSPRYPSIFNTVDLDGLSSFPLGFYADNDESRNLFYGLFSLLGKDKTFKILKNAIFKNNGIWNKIIKEQNLDKQETYNFFRNICKFK